MMNRRIEIDLFPSKPPAKRFHAGFKPQLEACWYSTSITKQGREPVPGARGRSQMRLQTSQRFGRDGGRSWRYCRIRIISILSRDCNGGFALLFLGAHALANFIQDALYFIDHCSSASGFSQLNLSTRFDATFQTVRGRAGIEVGDAFNQRLARYSKKAHAVEPVVSFAVMTVHCAGDRVIVNSQPAIKRKHD